MLGAQCNYLAAQHLDPLKAYAGPLSISITLFFAFAEGNLSREPYL